MGVVGEEEGMGRFSSVICSLVWAELMADPLVWLAVLIVWEEAVDGLKPVVGLPVRVDVDVEVVDDVGRGWSDDMELGLGEIFAVFEEGEFCVLAIFSAEVVDGQVHSGCRCVEKKVLWCALLFIDRGLVGVFDWEVEIPAAAANVEESKRRAVGWARQDKFYGEAVVLHGFFLFAV